MGKTYFNLVEQLNFDGKAIKLKGLDALDVRTEQADTADMGLSRDYIALYQSVLASQPQAGSPESTTGIPFSVYLCFLSSMPQVGAVRIEKDNNGKYKVSFLAALNKVTTGAKRNFIGPQRK